MNSLSGGIIDNFNYDNTGNQITTTNKTFNYNDSGALIHYSDNINNYNYLVNSLSQRVLKTDTNNSVNNKWFIYDENKQLISEYDNSNTVTNEYVYLNGAPIALFNNGILYNIYSDHLGTPRTITDQSNNIVWQWSNNEPFGANVPSISTIEFNLRFPGQYFDKESNLNYNYFRTYNPTIGKYIQSDPIGLDGGTNTYVYTDGNSLNGTDPFGLDTINLGISSSGGLLDKIGFWFEGRSKVNNDKNPNILTILAHGSPKTVHQFQPDLLSQQINTGIFKVGDQSISNNYFKNRVKKNQNIYIMLDSCDTGVYYYDRDEKKIEKPYAVRLGTILKTLALIENPNYTGIIQIEAPNGFTSWNLGLNPMIDKPHILPEINGYKGKLNAYSF